MSFIFFQISFCALIKLNIYVMTQFVSFKKLHNHQQTIEHLTYENQLLLKRNQILAIENDKLLQELDRVLQLAENSHSIKMQAIAEEQSKLFEQAKIDSVSLFHKLGRKVEGMIGRQVSVYKDILSRDCSVSQLYSCLTGIISRLLEENSQQRQQKIQDLLSNAESRLTLRKQARDKTQKVVHLIRQPPKELLLTLRELREECDHQRDLYQRIIRKVKRQIVGAHSLEQLYEQMDQLLTVRCKIRQEEGRLVIAQREFELGKFNPLSHQTIAAQLKDLRQSAKNLKAGIEKEIVSMQ